LEHCGPVGRLLFKHALDQVPEESGVAAGEGFVLLVDDDPREGKRRLGHERVVERRHFVEQNPQRPDVRFVVVRLVPHLLGSQVQRRARCRLVHHRLPHRLLS